MLGRVAIGRQGIGIIPLTRWAQHLMQKEVLMMEDTRIVKAVGMKKQGSWLNRE